MLSADPPAAPSSGPNSPSTTDDPVSTAFRVHDLSRRWVAYEMQNAFRQRDPVAADDVRSGERVEPSPVSGNGRTQPSVAPLAQAIAVPIWMRPSPTNGLDTESFDTGCRTAPYRSSGFLPLSTETRRQAYYGMMSNIACSYGLPVDLFDAMIIQESRYNRDIVSAKSAYGLTQLMPGTAAMLGVDRFDAEQNLRGGARYLRQQLDHFGQYHLALAAYNAGPARVRGVVPSIRETRAYVDAVLTNWARLSGIGSFTRNRQVAAKAETDRRTSWSAETRSF